MAATDTWCIARIVRRATPASFGKDAGRASSIESRSTQSKETALIADHLLAQQRNRRAAERQELVVEIMPQRLLVRGCCCACRVRLGDPVRPQLADHQLPERVAQVCRIIGTPRSLLAR